MSQGSNKISLEAQKVLEVGLRERERKPLVKTHLEGKRDKAKGRESTGCPPSAEGLNG